MRKLAILLLLLVPQTAAASWPTDPSTNVPVCVASGPQGGAESVSDGKGGVIVAWYDRRGANYDVYAQRIDATGTPRWTLNGIPVCNAASDQFELAIATDGAGGAIIAWSDFRGGVSYDVYAQRIDSTGTAKWTANGIAVGNAANDQTQPYALTDGSGGVFLAWTDERSGPGFGRIYVQRLNGSGVAQWTANGVATNNSPSGENYPRIVSNGAGGLVVAWHDYRNFEQDIYAQRILSNGALDPSWPVGGRAIATFWQEQEIGGLVADGSGGALLTWAQWNGGTRDILVHHVLASSALDPAWPAAGRKVTNDFYDQSNPAILSDGAGGVLVAYEDYHSSRDIRAHHVLASGAVDPAWPDTGLVVCNAPGDQTSPSLIASDSSAVVVWLDLRNSAPETSDNDLYAHRFLRTGVVDPAWPLAGRAVCTAAYTQHTPRLVADGASGVIVAWTDWRNQAGGDEAQIYAQAVKANGTLGDPPVGVPRDAAFDFALRSQNPVRPGAWTVHFVLPNSSPASLEVFDVAGRRVATREISGAGSHAVNLGTGWNAVPGVYFVRLSQGRLTGVRRLVLLD